MHPRLGLGRALGLHLSIVNPGHGVIASVLVIRAQADVVRYRPLLLVLAAGKTASSLGSLAFYLFDQDVFIYLLNFLVDGFLALVALWLWALVAKVDRPLNPG